MGRLILVDDKGRKRLLICRKGTHKVPGLGVVDFSKLGPESAGKRVEIAGKEFAVFEPSVLDLVETIQREAQIITPKDSASIIFNCDIRSGNSIVEVGTGSGAMTIVLACFVAPGGRVVSYERRRDFAEIAKRNVELAGVADIVRIKVKDAREGIDEKDFDSASVDIPDPWDVLHHVNSCLKPGGHIAVYVPTINQMERTVRVLRKLSFTSIRSIEILEREMETGEHGSRPSFQMLGHTGYLIFARKLE